MRNPPAPEVIALKVPTALADEIRRQARQDGRTVSSFLRRRLAVVFGMPELFSPQEDEPSQARMR
ncbi:MAG: hypothetical protein ABL986_04720 [Vicinamibacterales bacterium]